VHTSPSHSSTAPALGLRTCTAEFRTAPGAPVEQYTLQRDLDLMDRDNKAVLSKWIDR
jgi:hypothetical protein